MADQEDRTQAASERRLQRARDDGDVPVSRELTVAAALAAAALILGVGAWSIASGLARLLSMMLLDLSAPPELALRRAGAAWAAGAGPLLVAVLGAGSAGVLLQTRFSLKTRALAPELGRLDPRRGLKRVFGADTAIEAAKAVAKLAVLVWAVWAAMRSAWPLARQALLWTPVTLIDQIARQILHLLLMVLACQAAIAVLDVGWTRWRFGQRMRMSREDLKQEQKENDGDPRIKARIRQLRLARARRRMIAAVGKATVVVTNPTHYAVALAYERGANSAPRVVAKGLDDVAARIREAAGKAGVPLVPNPPLARALYAVALDAEVPAEHFKVVAEIIAYVWRLKGIAARR
jgi:flagellar biosynthetic protein FlhB